MTQGNGSDDLLWFGGSMTRLQLHHDGWLAVAVRGDARLQRRLLTAQRGCAVVHQVTAVLWRRSAQRRIAY